MPPMATWALLLVFCGQGVRDLVGWFAYAGVVALSLVALVVVFRRERHVVPRRALATTATAYCAWCCLSLLWSRFPAETAVAALAMAATTATGVLLACGLSLRGLTDALSRAVQAGVALSLAFELVVALAVRHPVAPLYMSGWATVPGSYMWSDGLLLSGGPVQGIVGNRNPLAFIALLCVLCTLVRWRDRQLTTRSFLAWEALSLLTIALTRSATVIMAMIGCGAVSLVLWGVRHVPGHRRRAVLTGIAASLVVLAPVALRVRPVVAQMLGRSADLSGRAEIWRSVLELWHQHTVLGWGWIMYWEPWLPVLARIAVRPDGTPTMSAHNAFVEALFQTGLVGLVLVVAVCLALLLGTGRLAVRYIDSEAPVLLPLLLTIALLVQTATESRFLSEGNWVVVTALLTWMTLLRAAERGDGRARLATVRTWRAA